MIERLGHALVDWLVPINTWTAVLLGCALLVDRAIARRARASLRMALYVPVALRVLLPLSWSIPLAHVPRVATFMPLQMLSASGPVESPRFGWPAALGLAYLAVALVLAVRAVVMRRQLARALASGRPLPTMKAPCPVLGHRERGPMVAGVWAPRIVLPESLLAGASDPALACILGHEAAHVRRGDPWLAAAIEAMLVVAWPVAPVWLAAARVRHLMELACDEEALSGANAEARRRYGHVLLDVAERSHLALVGVGALHFGSTLRARVEAIAFYRPWARWVQASLVGVAVAGFVACSSTGPGTTPQPTGGTHAAAGPGEGTDDYGYKYETDSLPHSSPQQAAPAATENADGRLAPELIQAVVRQNFGRFRSCYEKALVKSSTLQGTVTVSFVINPDGSVQNARDEKSTLPDADVVQCVVAGFSVLSFPPPQSTGSPGYVTVVYPVMFSPSD
jgi:TonB family protein